MAATAQDPSAPLRGPEKKDEDRDDDSALHWHFQARENMLLDAHSSLTML